MGEFAVRLKKLRTNAQLTQDELAPELGISRSTLGMYETGKREPDFETLETIADFFNVNMSYLTGYSDDPRDWEKIANELGICPPNDFDGDPENWYKMKMAQEPDALIDEYVHEIGEFLYYNPTHKTLFDASMQITKEDVPLASAMLTRISGNIMRTPSHIELKAAHERTDIEVTDEMRKHDDDIMNDENF